MTVMGKYCKAYLTKQLCEFIPLNQQLENIIKHRQKTDDKDANIEKILTDNDVLFLQENYVVTDGIFLNENVIFDDITPEWKDFCKNTLKFSIPNELVQN